jgi:hypothetical protein
MGIFARKTCERCGNKISKQADDRPICESCEEELALLVKACEEKSRECPIDGTPMSKAIAHLIVIDRCPTCQGVWLDAGELERMYSRASEDTLAEVTRNLWFPLGGAAV